MIVLQVELYTKSSQNYTFHKNNSNSKKPHLKRCGPSRLSS